MEDYKNNTKDVENVMFSILIAHYNNYNFFINCYESILNQTFQTFEVIILDDFSEKVQYNSILELVKNDKRFKIYRNESNKGVGYTKRKLAELANGEICGFLDPDDTIESNAIEVMVSHHENNPNASIINSNLNFCNEKLVKISSTNIEQIHQKNEFFFNFRGSISHFATFKKKFYNKTTGIDPYFRIAEDQDLYLKLYEVGESKQLDDVLYNYRVNPASLTNSSKQEISTYWHWVAAIKAAERRNVNIENLFVDKFVNRKDYNNISIKLDLLKKSRLLKLLNKLGLFKAYNYL
ncbi:glycosyltransferase [Empedobacter falsenii]|uniref:Glycosyltransferase n=2 Tax=Empedobacter TaxID=59734 RepID=A0A3R8TQQ0_9FLAO|nr:glycosyltransferase [Empedobacter falsenii]RRT92664.1 glycosyltransferase [Empedobacter falsenii]RRT92810.1 glycosyltransferase [Empedobacter falsenii]